MNTMTTARAFSVRRPWKRQCSRRGWSDRGEFHGDGGSTAEMYSPTQNTWSPAGSLVTARSHPDQCCSPRTGSSGRRQNATGTAISNTELYTPSTNPGALQVPSQLREPTPCRGATYRASDCCRRLRWNEHLVDRRAIQHCYGNVGTGLWPSECTCRCCQPRSCPVGRCWPSAESPGGVALGSVESYFAGAPAAFTNASTLTATTGATTTFSIQATGTPIPTIAENGTLPAGLSFSGGSAGAATITGTATGPIGSFVVTLTATNGVGSAATQQLTVTVAQPAAPGYLLVDKSGTVYPYGQAAKASDLSLSSTKRPAVAIARSPGTLGTTWSRRLETCTTRAARRSMDPLRTSVS